jgi:hypothetical protein
MRKQINRLAFAAAVATVVSIVALTGSGQTAVERVRGTSAGATTGSGAGAGAGTGAAGTAKKAGKGTTSNVKRSGSCGEFKYYDAKSRQCLDSRDKKK